MREAGRPWPQIMPEMPEHAAAASGPLVLHRLHDDLVNLTAAGNARSAAVAALQRCRIPHHMRRTWQSASSTKMPDNRSP
jgi:hypothetical protein